MVRNLVDRLSSVTRRGSGEVQEPPPREACFVCDARLPGSDLYTRYRVCHVCHFHYSMTARERIDSLIDPSSFREINRSITSLDPLSFSSRIGYRQRIFRDQRRTGLTEAVVTGTCSIGGSPAMLIVLDFGFMGGTMGCVVGEKVALALEQAAKRELPAIAIVTSGGVRVQEGALSLMQMAKTAIAAKLLNEKGLPFISVLANPATGQAYASFANLADIILGEPAAIVGFSPMSTIKLGSSSPLPSDSHTTESHVEHGMIDAIVQRTDLRNLLSAYLDLLGPQYRLTPRDKRRPEKFEVQGNEAWSSVQLARHHQRPSTIDYIARIFTSFVELHGDRAHGDDPSMICGFGHLGGQTVVVLGHDRGSDDGPDNDGRMSPEGFRKAQRAIRLAAKFDFPLLSLIDTPGPDTTLAAEERGLGNAIATTMAEIAGIEVPSIAVVIGEGGSAAALALGVTDRVLMMENAIYSAVSPEEAAEMMFQDPSKAEEAAESLRLTAQDCRELGIADRLIPEPPEGAHTNPDDAARQLRRVLVEELADLQSKSQRRRLRNRYKKFRKMGEYSSHFRAAIRREVDALQGFVTTGVKRVARRGPAEPADDADDLLTDAPAISGDSNGSRPSS